MPPCEDEVIANYSHGEPAGVAARLKEWIRPFYLKWFYFRLRPAMKPTCWTASWSFPEHDLDSPVASTGRTVVFLPMVDWHARIQRPQHLARTLARMGVRCFFLNPNLGREFPGPALLSRRLAVCRLEERVYEVHIGLPREPVYHHRMLERLESDSIAAALARVLAGFGARDPILISQFPLWNDVASALQRQFHGLLVYDCHDLLSGFERISLEIIAAENALLLQADLVVFTAKTLIDKFTREHPWLAGKSVVIRNAVDVTHFRPAGAKGKVAGYAGSLDDWFDIEAIRAAATAHPDVTFVMLGRIENPKAKELEALPNVRLYGEVPYERLPDYMAEFDVALIPFQITPLTIATNPIKLYEYFSCGLPVVSTRLPEVGQFGELVYLADTPEQFARQVGFALAEEGDDLREQRRSVARKESWAERAAQLLDAIENTTRRE